MAEEETQVYEPAPAAPPAPPAPTAPPVPATPATPASPAAPTKPSFKYLGFIPIAIVQLSAYVTAIYDYGKDSCGPLKPGVDSVEGTVKTVVGPVYQKYKGKPLELLVFVDGKVDVVVHFLDGVLPPKVKETGHQAIDAAKSVVSDVQSQGLQGTAKTYHDKYEPVVESFAVDVYKKAVQFPLVPQAISVTRFFAVKVNQIILIFKENGLPLAGYVPLLPVSYFDKIAQKG